MEKTQLKNVYFQQMLKEKKQTKKPLPTDPT